MKSCCHPTQPKLHFFHSCDHCWFLRCPFSHCFFPFHHPTISHCWFNKIKFACFPSFTPPSLPVCETAATKWWPSSHRLRIRLTVSLLNSFFFLESALLCCRDGWFAAHGLTLSLISLLSSIRSRHPQYTSPILLLQTSCLVPFLLKACACVCWNAAFQGG